ncbi:hypothetical protein [Candidatus Protofrankia californiensis]|uniref:hypothetical protein n=1 Tax=Candidatus Protofrankia californiensis TaxID=1839754 RepID=UPI00104119DC|nr:hypothetical protein [Candidatus Protofrankia californiensis]
MKLPAHAPADSGEPGSSLHLGLHVGGDWTVFCHRYPDRAPILGIDTRTAYLTLSVQDRMVTAGHLEFAYALVQAANDYLLECERLMLEAADTGPDEGSAAAA